MLIARILSKRILKHRIKAWTNYSSASNFRSDVVVCGGGLSGLSIAYHLAKRGASVYLLERGNIGAAGASSLCTGIMTSPCFYWDNGTHKIVANSLKLYENIAQNYPIQLQKCGRVYMAQNDATIDTVNRMYSRARIWNDSAELIDDSSDIRNRWPMVNADDIKLAFYSPDDVALDPIALCHALKNEAIKMGAQILEDTSVKYVLIGEGQRVYAIETDAGLIETNIFVNAAGIWANMIPVKNLLSPTIRTAIHPCTYTFLSTDKLPQMGINDNTPIFVDLDNSLFLRATEYGTTMAGFHEPSITSLGLPQENWHIPPVDWDKFYPVLSALLHRFPSLGQCSKSDLISGAEAYTPDGYPIVGESEQARGYFVANGMNGRGLPLAGGVGELLSNWILDGFSQTDISKVDATRFIDMHLNLHYLHERCPEVASNTFKPFHYSHQCHTARNLRMCPIYYKLKDAGAIFGEIMGYERPLWFKIISTGTRSSLHSGLDFLSKKNEWFPCVAREYEACRERVGLIDMSSFSKFEIKGPDAVKFLQQLCSADVDRPIGSTIYTGMQNERGGYVTDATMSRIAEDHYFIVAPTIQQLRCMVWMKRWASTWKMHVDIQDVTGLYTALNIVGPSSRYLMQDITGRPMTSTDFPTFQCRIIDIGYATGIRAISITHCGELGWVIYIPNEMAQHVYDKLIDCGQEYGLLHSGYYTLRHLRIEKFYVYWGQDIDATTTPVECGRVFRKDFLGKQALEKQMETGVSKRFVQLLVDRHDLEADPWPQGSEVIYRDGKMVGWTTSAAYGFTLGCPVCIGYLENEDFGISQEFCNTGFYEIDIANRRFPVRVNLHSPSLPMISSEHPMHYRPTQ